MKNLIQMAGYYTSNEVQIPFLVEISMPQREEREDGSEDYLCDVISQQLFTRCMKVYGATCNQAIELAINLVNTILTHRVTAQERDELDQDSEKPSF